MCTWGVQGRCLGEHLDPSPLPAGGSRQCGPFWGLKGHGIRLRTPLRGEAGVGRSSPSRSFLALKASKSFPGI